MIIPCIDLMGGKVVQLVQGRDKALEGDAPLEMLAKFAAFPEIQVIDLDAAMGRGENSALVELLASRAKCRVGGGVRNAERARKLIEQGAHRVIVGTAAFTPAIEEIAAAVGPERILIALDSKDGKIVVKGWQEATGVHGGRSDRPAGAFLRRISVHLRRQRRNDAGDRSRLVPADCARRPRMRSPRRVASPRSKRFARWRR